MQNLSSRCGLDTIETHSKWYHSLNTGNLGPEHWRTAWTQVIWRRTVELQLGCTQVNTRLVNLTQCTTLPGLSRRTVHRTTSTHTDTHTVNTQVINPYPYCIHKMSCSISFIEIVSFICSYSVWWALLAPTTNSCIIWYWSYVDLAWKLLFTFCSLQASF